MKMTLARALRYKKRVLESIQKLETDIQLSNSVVEGEEREADVRQALKTRDSWVKHLTELKVAMQTATLPVQKLIFELSEAKSKITLLQRLDVKHGTQKSRYREEQSLKYTAEIRKSERDKMITALQTEIDQLQTQIDTHNAKTSIDVADVDLP